MGTSLKDKTVVVTGGTRGIGKETATGLARLGATVALVGRDEARGAAAAAEIRAATANENVVFLQADLSSLADVRRLAAEVTARFERVHVLVNNAAVVRAARRLTADGFEETLAVGHLAPVLLTELLLPTLQRSAPARVVNVSSGVVHRAKPDLDDLQSERTFHPLAAYGRAKLLNLSWTLELARRLEGTGVSVVAVDPGVADTGTHRDYPRPAPIRAIMRLAWLLLRSRLSVERAAQAVIRATSAPEPASESGFLLDRNGQRVDPPSLVRDRAVRRTAGEVTRKLVGLDQPVTVAEALG